MRVNHRRLLLLVAALLVAPALWGGIATRNVPLAVAAGLFIAFLLIAAARSKASH
jgi:hypothetical protein